MWLLLVVCVLLLFVYVLFIKYSYWKHKGIPGPRPVPIMGNIGPNILGQKTIYEVYADIYDQYKDHPFVGTYIMLKPCLLLRDPELIKNVFIKDFNYFMDQDFHVDKKVDPLFGRNPFVLKGEEWKKARQFVTPHFTSGKIKGIFPIAEHASKDFVKYLEKHENSTLDAKDVLLRYACDVGAICAFGIEGNSYDDSNSRVLKLIRSFKISDTLQLLKLIISFFLPNLVTVKVLSQSFDDQLIALTQETIKYRQEHNISRNDYFDIITKTPISLIEMAAHLATFIMDGTITISLVMPLILYELATNPDCQTKLRAEISNVLKNNNSEISYEALQSMDYLEACINESLRLHPPFASLSRCCVEDYTFTSSDKNMNVTVKKGMSVIIPVLGIHRDSNYFEFPNKYMPERFLEKIDSQKYVFMPFGNGPRMCLGTRFALMLMKVAIMQVIRNFEVTLDAKMKHPLKFDPFSFGFYPKGGVWIRCKKIEHT